MLKRALLLFAIIFTPFLVQAAAPSWTIDAARSTLNFDSTQSGQPFTGEFKKFSGAIAFDPAHPDQSHAAITIDIASISVGGEGDQYIGAPEWFDTAKFPAAKFETTKFEKTGADQFIAHGNLTIRDVTLPVDLPFTLTITPDGHSAKMQGKLTLNRLNYHLGTGDWANPKTVSTDVTVRVNVTATKAP